MELEGKKLDGLWNSSLYNQENTLIRMVRAETHRPYTEAMKPQMNTKQVIVLSDHQGLARLIALTLHKDALASEALRIVSIDPSTPQESALMATDLSCKPKTAALIVIALSAHDSEPLVALVQAGLEGCIGKVPILIISDRPFQPALDVQIVHLTFPFLFDELRDTVRAMLQKASTL